VSKTNFDGVERSGINESYYGILSTQIVEGKINVTIKNKSETVYSKWFKIEEVISQAELKTCKCYKAIDEQTLETLEVRICDKGVLYLYNSILNSIDIKSNILIKNL
jgi:hypothetical protein